MTHDHAAPETDRPTAPSSPAPDAPPQLFSLARVLRTAVAGILMGTANLIPGVSGGTMVLAMGLYQEFIDSVADITALRLGLRRIVFLGVLGGFALAAIVLLAKLILFLLFHYPTAMYALFIGLTLGGAPTLLRALRPLRADAIIATIIGLLLMIGVWQLRAGVGFPHHALMDFVSGVVGATTMVLPGVSGSYMLLVMDQYERVIGSIDDRNFKIIIPVAIGAALGIVGLSNLLKFLLRRFARPTVGVLLGILLGSVIGLWPFDKEPGQKALERRSPAELRTFVQRWQIPAVADLDDRSDSPANQQTLAAAILQHWPQRGESAYKAQRVATAALLVILGFAATYLISRRHTRAGSNDAAPLPATPSQEPRQV